MEDITIQESDRKKKYLRRYKKNLALVDRLELKLLDLDERLCKIKSPKYSDAPRGGVPVDLADLLDEKIELEKRINRLLEKGRKYKVEILDKIDGLDDTRHVEILEAFFIDCKSFDEIADNTGYTKRHVIRLYTEAIALMSF